ncbi:hypothetical protein SLH49_06945 [Cognatiyoonia sp. IB215446]|uniref:hypothetical protein n=1 Tax=Cognatiyoonia sp. IB215446 TaxID=3097355 RepID=UPI002A17A9EB|nr:hypothetical protein [Cognatiyoonia sp. IB215446]MDX8347719.1 hypothetical protein [Cognatiyoonia sp. IB215446]
MRPANEPDLMRLYLRHCAVGFALAAAFVAMLLWFNVANLGYLVTHTDVGYLAVFLLWFFHGTIFGSVQFAVSLMLNAEKDDEGPRGGTPVAVRVPSETPRRI